VAVLSGSTFKARLRRREPLIGTLLTLPSPEIAEICAGAGFDWLFVDMEHGLLDFAAAQRLIQAAGSCPCIVRVPMNEPIWIAKAIDTGAAGVIFPHINTASEARQAIRAGRYPPAGTRSLGVARAQGFGTRVQHSVDHDNASLALVPQAEHIDAARQIGEILATPGVDAIFSGPFDLSASLGRLAILRYRPPSARFAMRALPPRWPPAFSSWTPNPRGTRSARGTRSSAWRPRRCC
jgi:2-keto-3-deoxy-L-rhamnonate aldolase RhmA